MLPILVVVFLSWKDPAALVADLSDDSIEVRERAVDELYRRGEAMRGVLIDAHDDALNPETRARVKGILRRLDADDRIRWFAGGNRVGGFAIQLRSDRWYGSGPFRLTLEVMNLAPRDQEFPGISVWDLEQPEMETRTTGAHAKVTVKKFISSGGFRRTSWGTGDPSARVPVSLRSGDVVRYEYTLDAKSLPAGDYDVAVEYFARELLPDADHNLRS